jgi:hypothetical protein
MMQPSGSAGRAVWKFINSPTRHIACAGRFRNFVRPEQCRNGLDLQDDGVRDEYVGTEAQRRLHEYRSANLGTGTEYSLFKLKAHTPSPNSKLEYGYTPQQPTRIFRVNMKKG